jgi:hypothetical protein
MEQEQKLARALNQTAEVQQIETKIDGLENIAVGLGFTRLRNSRGDRIGICQVMPSATDSIKNVLDEDRAYRLLSAVAHGHQWAIRQLGFKMGDTTVSPEGVTLTAITKHYGTVEGYGYLGVRALKSLALPLWNQSLYFGWDKTRLTAILESVYDQIKTTPAVRFWR